MFPFFGTFLIVSAFTFGMTLYGMSRRNQTYLESAPLPLIQTTTTTTTEKFEDISDAVCDCKLLELCSTLERVTNRTKYCSQEENSKERICCPLDFTASGNEIEISNRLALEDSIAIPSNPEGYTDDDELPETTTTRFLNDVEDAFSLRGISENQVSFKTHKNFKLLPLWKKCGLSLVNAGIRKPRIVGGEKVDEREFPWIVRLGYTKQIGGKEITVYKCAGTILNQRYIISAGHCNVNFGTPNEVLALTANGKNISLKAEKVFVHPLFNKTNKINDIMLIRLSDYKNSEAEVGNKTFNNELVPICLPFFNEYGVDIGSLHQNSDNVLGWGTGTWNTTKLSENLVKLGVSIVPNTLCNRVFGNYFQVIESQMCAGGIVGQDTCQGDSGGPLESTYDSPTLTFGPIHVQFGITSFGSKVCGKGVPGIYTRISSHLQWILDTIEP